MSIVFKMNSSIQKVSGKFVKNLETMLNEPSLALYRIQEHIHKSVLHINTQNMQCDEIQAKFSNILYDIEENRKSLELLQHTNTRLDKLLHILEEKSD